MRSLLAIGALSGALASCDGEVKAADVRAVDQSVASTTNDEGLSADALDQLRHIGYVEWEPASEADLSGVIAHTPARVAPGYNLYSDSRNAVFLIDNDGELVHSWTVAKTNSITCVWLTRNGDMVAGNDSSRISKAHSAHRPQQVATPSELRSSCSDTAPSDAASRIWFSVTPLQRQTYTLASPDAS